MTGLENKHIVVVGMGRTGFAVSRFCARRGARVTVSDRAAAVDSRDQIEELKALGVSLELGGHREETFRSAQLIVMSPGVPETIAPVRAAAEAGVPVTGEIELAAGFIDTPIVAVTGTNGKTTCCELLADMLNRSGLEVFLGGNIGNPLINYPDQDRKADVLVVEISSFQLDTISRFRPRVGVLLNISPDHLDRYPDFETYAASKMRLFENQRRTDTAVLNALDPVIARLSGGLAGRRLYYPQLEGRRGGAILEKGGIRLKGVLPNQDRPQTEKAWITLEKFRLVGRHNRENACAAAVAAIAAGGSVSGVQRAIDRFEGLPHRLEKIARIGGVDYLNDSKATNVDAVARALPCFESPTILIMGGLDKGGDFESLAEIVSERCRLLIVTGAAADRIRAALGKAAPVRHAESLSEAVQIAHRQASPGDTVLLSPGCASFDRYENYRERGRDFRRAVNSLGLKPAGDGHSNEPEAYRTDQ